MSIYSVFAWLAAFTIALSFVTAILGILSAGNRMVVRMLFFALPASALFRLLSRPLTEQSPYLISSYVAVVCVWLLPGASMSDAAFLDHQRHPTMWHKTSNQAIELTP